jgi:hypothetical protein
MCSSFDISSSEDASKETNGSTYIKTHILGVFLNLDLIISRIILNFETRYMLRPMMCLKGHLMDSWFKINLIENCSSMYT